MFYPSVQDTFCSNIFTHTLIGCTKLCASPTLCKWAISHDEIITVTLWLSSINNYDILLFLAIVYVTFFGLMCIGENVWPDNPALCNYWKVIKCSLVSITMDWLSPRITYFLLILNFGFMQIGPFWPAIGFSPCPILILVQISWVIPSNLAVLLSMP